MSSLCSDHVRSHTFPSHTVSLTSQTLSLFEDTKAEPFLVELVLDLILISSTASLAYLQLSFDFALLSCGVWSPLPSL